MRRDILSSSVMVGLARLAGIGLGLLVTVVIARKLGPSGLGAYGYAVMVLALLATPISNGWSTLVLRRVSAALHDGEWATAKGTLVLGTQIAAILTACVWVVAYLTTLLPKPSLPAYWNLTTVSLLAAVLFCDQLGALRMSVLRGLNLPVWGQLPEVLLRPGLIVICFSILGFWLHERISLQDAFLALVLAATASAVAGGVILWKKAPRAFSTSAAAFHKREWIGTSAVLAGNSGLILLNSYVDVLMLGALSTLEELGIYRVAMQVSLFSGFAYTVLNMLAMQRFAYLRAKGDQKALKDSAVFMARLALAGSIPLPLIFAVFGKDILGLVFGPAFVPAIVPMFVLFANQAILASFGMVRTLLVMSGRESSLLRYILICIGINFALCFLLVPLWGSLGAALATTASSLAWNLLIWSFALREIKIDSSVLGLTRAPNPKLEG